MSHERPNWFRSRVLFFLGRTVPAPSCNFSHSRTPDVLFFHCSTILYYYRFWSSCWIRWRALFRVWIWLGRFQVKNRFPEPVFQCYRFVNPGSSSIPLKWFESEWIDWFFLSDVQVFLASIDDSRSICSFLWSRFVGLGEGDWQFLIKFNFNKDNLVNPSRCHSQW